MSVAPLRYYIALEDAKLVELVRQAAADPEFEKVREKVREFLIKELGIEDEALKVVSIPTLLRLGHSDLKSHDGALTSDDRNKLKVTIAFLTGWTVEQTRGVLEKNKLGVKIDAGVDVPVHGALHWNPYVTGPFGDRAAAERLIGANALRSQGLRGQGVKIALFDQSMEISQHAAHIARHIQSLAPSVTIRHYPVLPERITNVQAYLSNLFDVYVTFLSDYENEKGTWVAVNAWSIFDCRPGSTEFGSLHESTDAFNKLLKCLSEKNIDVVFAAGNCGQFCPDGRCASYNRVPGASIIGPNTHPDALTVGAVRADGMWAGYSSQGPGQTLQGRQKPDLCGPSGFHETGDAATIHGGTSTACGVVAGVVAALRQGWKADSVSSERLREVLRATSRSDTRTWNERTGFGVIDAAAASEALQAIQPAALIA